MVMHQLLMSQTDDIWWPSCNLMTWKLIVATLSVVMMFAADLHKLCVSIHMHCICMLMQSLRKSAVNVITTERVATIDLHVIKLQDGHQISSVCDIRS